MTYKQLSEAIRRCLRPFMRHFDIQLGGGMLSLAGWLLAVICSGLIMVWLLSCLAIFTGLLVERYRKVAAKDKCNRCNKKFKLTVDNTVAYLFSRTGFEDYSYYTTACPHCEVKNWTFCRGYLPELTEIIRTIGCKVIVKDYPSTKVIADWNKVYGIKLLKTRELDDIDENIIGFWRFLLSADDKYLWQEFD